MYSATTNNISILTNRRYDMAHILGISGSLREGANTLVLVENVLAHARELGAETTLLDLKDYPLPFYEAHVNYDGVEAAEKLAALVSQADAIVLGSPEYHACMSGALKNAMDFLYRELAGKVCGLVSATGGSQGVGCFDNMRAAVHACHGWVLPYVTSATGRDIDVDKNIINDRVKDRLRRMARDLIIYGPLLKAQFERDLAQPDDSAPGFAQWM
jgi:azobenzene reductase